MNFARVSALILAALFLIFSVAWFTGIPHPAREMHIIQEWDSAVRRLGITPVFPPREDTQVGDLYLISGSQTADETEPRSSQIWLGDLGLAGPIKNFYKDRFAMPAENGGKPIGSAKDSKDWIPPPAETANIFGTGAVPKRLRSVAFPSFTVASSRLAKLSVSDSVLQFFSSGSFGQSNYNVTISVPNAESYGVPALTALALVANNCILKDSINQLVQMYPTLTKPKSLS